MSQWKGIIWLASSLILVVVLSRTFQFDPLERNLETMTEMVYAPAYDAYEYNPLFADGATMRPPIAGTIARGHLPLVPGESLTLDSAKYLVNPVEITPATIKRGASVYATFCQVCHGASGDGDGPVTKRGVPPPPPYTHESLTKYTDGQLYQIISEGKGNMASYKGQIRAKDRWIVVQHLRSMRSAP